MLPARRPLLFCLTHGCSSTDRAQLRLTILLIATLPPETDLDDEQSRALLASLLYLQEREANADLSLCKRKLDVKFISRSDKYGETRCVVFKQKTGESRNVFRQRRCFLTNSEGFWETMNRYSDSLKRRSLQNRSSRDTEITCLRKRNLKSGSNNVKWRLLTLAFVIFRDNLIPIVWKSIAPRLHEELAQRERVLRETQIRSIHEAGQLRELRVDEFSVQTLRQSHATIQELTSHKYMSCRNE